MTEESVREVNSMKVVSLVQLLAPNELEEKFISQSEANQTAARSEQIVVLRYPRAFKATT